MTLTARKSRSFSITLLLLTFWPFFAPIAQEQEGISPQYEDEGGSTSTIFDVLFGSSHNKDDEGEGPVLQTNESGVSTIEGESSSVKKKSARLNVIDKTLGKLYPITVASSQKEQVNEIVVRVHSCIAPNYATLTPEGRARVEIFETKNRHSNKIFDGWLYAHSHSASQVTHPKYDVILYECQ
jgi:hypothetical protein